jgi:hypothetical protein
MRKAPGHGQTQNVEQHSEREHAHATRPQAAKEVCTGSETDRKNEQEEEDGLHRGGHWHSELPHDEAGQKRPYHRAQLEPAYSHRPCEVTQRERQEQRKRWIISQGIAEPVHGAVSPFRQN